MRWTKTARAAGLKGFWSVEQSPAGGQSLVIYTRVWYWGWYQLVFVSNLEDVADCTLSRFSEDRNLTGLVYVAGPLSGWRMWPAGISREKLNQGKCSVLNLERSNSAPVAAGGQLSAKQLSSKELTQGNLLGPAACPCDKGPVASWRGVISRLREVIVPFCSAPWRWYLEDCVHFRDILEQVQRRAWEDD